MFFMLDSGYPVCNLNKSFSVFGELARGASERRWFRIVFSQLFVNRKDTLILCMNMRLTHVVTEWSC